MRSFLKHTLQLIVSPAKGWEDISHAGLPVAKLTSDGLYPFLGITALSVFITGFYNSDTTLIQLIQGAIITFVKYFVTYFLAIAMFASLVKKMVDGDLNDKKSQTFILYNVGLLALYNIIGNCLPVQLSIVQFLPLYSAIIIWKGARYMAVKQELAFQFSLLGIAVIILPPYLLDWIFSSIISPN